MNETEYDELKRLRIENARLQSLLARHGIFLFIDYYNPHLN